MCNDRRLRRASQLGGVEEAVARKLLPFRVVPELTEVERNTRLTPGDLGVMTWRDRERVTWADLKIAAVVHVHRHGSRDAVAQV
jgi:hypothetical protein